MLTFPASHSAKTKTQNVEEDWLIQIGFDDGFSKATSLLAEAIDISETAWDVDDGSEFTAGRYIKVDSEVVLVNAILLDTITVTRAQKGTSAAIHTDNSEIFHDDYIGLSSIDRIVSTFQYYGLITDFGELVHSINIVKCSASIATLSLTCQNKWKTTKLSEELFGGSKKYLNRRVRIYSCLDNASTIGNCAFLEELRISSISHDDEFVYLQLEQDEPWDGIQIPNSKNDYNQLIPVIYGNYTPESSSSGSEDYLDAFTLHPAPVVNVNGLYVLSHVYGSIASNANPHLYESDINGFAPMEEADAASEAWKGSYVIRADLDMERSFKFTANEVNTDATPAMTNPSNAFTVRGDRSVSNSSYAQGQSSLVDADNESHLLYLRLPQLEYGKCSSVKLYVNYAVDIDSCNGVGSEFTLYDQSYGTGATQQNLIVNRTSAGQSGDDSAGTWFEIDWYTANRYQAADSLPDQIKLNATFVSVLGGDIGGWCRIYDVYVKVTVAHEVDSAHLVQALDFSRSIENMYCGGDGYSEGFTDGSGTTASLPHEIHRDILYRFAGLDYDDDYMRGYHSSLQYLSDDLDSARAGWHMRLWFLEPTDLSDILEQIQFEGCFIFFLTHDADGNGNAGGKYIWVHDTYASGDVSYTLTDSDYKNLRIRTTSIKDIKTQTTYNFQRHPARNDYVQSEVYTNSEATSDWGFVTGQDYEEIDLDFLCSCGDNTEDIYDTGSTDGDNAPNESIVIYRDNLVGSPKILVDLEVTNPSMYDLERGDIIQLNDSELNPYGKSWGDLYFIIEETRRSPNNLEISAKEVYEAP